MKSPQVVIGISCFYHDSAVAFFVDEQLVFAAHEERYTRIKGDSSFPHSALLAGISEVGVSLDDIHAFVFYEKPFKKLSRILENLYYAAPRGLKQFEFAIQELSSGKLDVKNLLAKEILESVSGHFNPLLPFDSLGEPSSKKIKTISEKIKFSSHHDSHAASSYFCSGLDRAHVLVLDAVGEEETGTFFEGSGRYLTKLEALHYPHSYGMVYSAVTHHLGFKVNSGEYKVMGLAPYGRPKFVSQLKNALLHDSGINFALNLRQFGYLDSLVITSRYFLNELAIPQRTQNEPLTQVHCDLAASIQKLLEDEVEALLEEFVDKYQPENLCLAGGVALNCVNNSVIAKKFAFTNIFVQPASGDAGGALGAALVYLNKVKDHKVSVDVFTPYLGSRYDDQEKTAVLCAKAKGLPYKHLGDEELIAYVSDKLASRNILGWFQGRSEFGPRSLGHRSILALPTKAETQIEINLKIKFRESFRPFAPICLEEYASDFFECVGDTRFMLFVSKTIGSTPLENIDFGKLEQNLKLTHPNLPAITHVDGTARLQTINAIQNSKLHSVISKVNEITGVPILVNTSFNVRGEPIVETPEDAFNCFVGTNLDCLVIGNVVVEKPEGYVVSAHSEMFDLD